MFYQAEFCYSGTEEGCRLALQKTLNKFDCSFGEEAIRIVGVDSKGSAQYAGFRLEQGSPQHGFLILQKGLNGKYAVLRISYCTYDHDRAIYYCEDTPIYDRDFLVVMGDECSFDSYTAEHHLSYPGRMFSQQRDHVLGPDRSFLKFIEKGSIQPVGLEMPPVSITTVSLRFGEDAETISALRQFGAGIGGPEISDEAYIPIWTMLALEGLYLLFMLLKSLKRKKSRA